MTITIKVSATDDTGDVLWSYTDPHQPFSSTGKEGLDHARVALIVIRSLWRYVKWAFPEIPPETLT